MQQAHWAAVFPGQGSQSVGMLSHLSTSVIVQNLFRHASDVLGYDLWQLVVEGPEEKLNQTIFTQPILLTANVAVWQFLREQQLPNPLVMAGHSLGEFAALVCAESITFEDGLRLVAERARLMQAAVPLGEGAMGAIVKLEDAEIKAICESVGDVQPANFNAIGQTVIAGKKTAVEKALAIAKEKGCRLAKLLPMSVPSHCYLMQPAADGLKSFLATIPIASPKIPVIHNVDVEVHAEPEKIREALVAQLIHPVRWVETVQKMAAMGVERTVEIGPGKVLQGLNKRIIETMTHLSTGDADFIQMVGEENQ